MVGQKKQAREHRYTFLKRELEAVLRSRKPGEPLPSYTEMIRTYGVGQSTIDRVLRDFETSGLITRHAGKGIFVSPRASKKTVGFVLGRDVFQPGHSPICSMLLQQCRDRARKGRENFKFYLDLPDAAEIHADISLHHELLDDIKSERLDGVMLVWSYGPEETKWVRSFGTPLVSLGAEADVDAHSVIIDYIDLVKQGAKALAEAGCRKIGFLSSSGYLRQRGFRRDISQIEAVLGRHGLQLDPELVLEDRSDRSINAGGTMSNEELGFDIMRTFLTARRVAGGAPLPFDGLISDDDMMTRGILAALHENGTVLNERLQIATHANKNSPALMGYERNLILLQIDPHEIVNAMFSLLEPMMEGRKIEKTKRYIKPKLIPPAGK